MRTSLVAGIIFANAEDSMLKKLTSNRSMASVPFGARFRIIDFALSNLVNAGVSSVGIITKENYRSLMDHVGNGVAWDLDRKKQGLNILPPNLRKVQEGAIRGDIDLLAGVYDFIKRSHQTYVILSLGTHIYNLNYEAVVEEHISRQADVTVLYKDMTGLEESELTRFTLLELDADKRITDMEMKPYYPKSSITGMDVYVMEKELLLSIIDECSARGEHDFVKDAILKKLSALTVYGYEFNGYTDKIDSLKSYYKNNMIFLNQEIRQDLLNPSNPVYTKFKDQSPTKYGEGAVVENSLISDGCVIEGTVINSVLSRGVVVKAGAVVKNSIIMQDSVIEEDVHLEHIVFDKEVYITKGKKLIGQEVYPLSISKGSTI